MKDCEARHDGKGRRLKSMKIADKKYDLVLILTSNLLKHNFQKVKKISKTYQPMLNKSEKRVNYTNRILYK